MTRMGAAIFAGVVVLLGLGLYAFWQSGAKRAAKTALTGAFSQPLAAPEGALAVYHLGHSLVGRDMPAMLAQLAEAGGIGAHRYDSQLGWGTSLREHYEPDLPINGFEAENDHPRYRDAEEALASGEYDAVVLTEMVEIKDAVKYHKSAQYLQRWAARARAGNPDVRLYLYETWHHVDDPAGWLTRLDGDLERYWLGEILGPALAKEPATPIHVIPAGQVMAEFTRRAEAGEAGVAFSREDLFARREDGTLDTIHVNDLGAYLVALTHYAVLYHRDPRGLAHQLLRADGQAAVAPEAALAKLMQETVWDVVTKMPMTGLRRERG